MGEVDGEIFAVVQFLPLLQVLAIQGEVRVWYPRCVGGRPNMFVRVGCSIQFCTAESKKNALLIDDPQWGTAIHTGLIFGDPCKLFGCYAEGPFLDFAFSPGKGLRLSNERLQMQIERM